MKFTHFFSPDWHTYVSFGWACGCGSVPFKRALCLRAALSLSRALSSSCCKLVCVGFGAGAALEKEAGAGARDGHGPSPVRRSHRLPRPRSHGARRTHPGSSLRTEQERRDASREFRLRGQVQCSMQSTQVAQFDYQPWEC